MALNRDETERELELYSLRISRKTDELYNEVDTLLKSLILTETTLKKAQKQLNKAYEDALASTNFQQYFTNQTVDIIAEASYSEAVLNTAVKSKAEYKRKLPRISLFDDEIKLSERIRLNYDEIVKGHKKILDDALEAGQGIVKTARQINNAGGFDPEIPKYIRDLQSQKIAGKKLPQSTINRVKRQIQSIKTPGLRRNYTKLVNAINLDKNVDQAVSDALAAKSRAFADRLARSETINTQANVKVARHVKDPKTQWIKSVTSGSNPCNFCLAMESLKWIPVESAPKFIFHPNDTCTLHFKRSATQKADLWTQEKYEKNLNNALDKIGVTYVKPTPLRNLRENTIVDKLQKIKE